MKLPAMKIGMKFPVFIGGGEPPIHERLMEIGRLFQKET